MSSSKSSLGGSRVLLYVAIAALVIAACVGLPILSSAAIQIVRSLAPAATLPPPPTLAISTPVATSTPTSAPVCGGPPNEFILLIGSDTRANTYAAGLSDSMRIMRVDFVRPGITYLTFQRDLYVEIPGIASHGGITHGKLNQAYLYGNSAFGYYDGPGQGPGLLALTLKQNFGARVDHYVAVNLQSFARIVDQLGGIDISLPRAIDGRAKRSRDSSRYFPAGPQHLDGYRTMILARLRPDGDIERSATQDLILHALAVKVLTPTVLPKMPGVIQAVYGSVQTDLGADDIRKLLCLGSMLDSSKIAARDFPESLFTGTRIHDPVLGYTFIWNVDFNILREYVAAFNAADWPATPVIQP
jgi:LCP family protein required for cell wall assembly